MRAEFVQGDSTKFHSLLTWLVEHVFERPLFLFRYHLLNPLEGAVKKNALPIVAHVSSTRRPFERHKRPADLLMFSTLLFAVLVQHLQDWPVADGEQIRLLLRLVVHTGAGRHGPGRRCT